MRVVLELRAGIQPLVVLNNLFKLTPLQSTTSINMLAIVDRMPRVVTMQQALRHFLDFREEVVRRRTEYEVARARQRAHILAGLRIATDNLDDVIELIRGSESAGAARQRLIEQYSLDEDQAQAILDMQLRRLAALEQEQLETEYRQLLQTISEKEAILASRDLLVAEVKSEIVSVLEQYGDSRRTEIRAEAGDLSREALEPHEQVVVTLSQAGYVKRIQADSFRTQHRGGKGVGGMTTRDDDAVAMLLVVDTHDRLLMFTSKGRVYSLKAYEIRADTSRATRGVPLSSLIPIEGSERITAMLALSAAQMAAQDSQLVLATAGGRIKRLQVSEVSEVRPSGLIVMGLLERDQLVSVRSANEDKDIIMVSRNGMSIRYPSDTVRPQGRSARGVRGMTLGKGDRIVGMDVGLPEDRLMVISDLGYGKITALDKYRLTGRGGKGIKTLNIRKKTGPIAAAQVVSDRAEVYVVSRQAQVMKTSLSEIRSTGRATLGVTIFKPAPGDVVATVFCVHDMPEHENQAQMAEKPASANGAIQGALLE